MRRRSYTHDGGVDLFLICFSLVTRNSMANVEKKYLPEILELCPGVPFLLVGTKQDLRDDPNYVRLERDSEETRMS